MPARIKMKLALLEQITPHASFGSLLHGFLMQQLGGEAAGMLHQEGLKPFSQYFLALSPHEALWVVNILHSQANEIKEVLGREELKEIYLEQKGAALKILDREIETLPNYREMAAAYYLGELSSRRWRLKILTPAAFKSGGRYQMMPTTRLIYQNLLNRWNQFAHEVSLAGEDVCDTLADYTEITAYNLRSYSFHLEGVKIPAFLGWVDLHVRGPEALARIAVLLFNFAEMAGLGIKTALGMGGIEVGARAVCSDRRH